MDIKEILKSIVETEDKMERMKIVEDNMNLFESSSIDESESNNEEMEVLKTENESLKREIEEQKQRYIDRFFSDDGNNTDNNDSEEESEDVKEEVEKKSLNEILGE